LVGLGVSAEAITVVKFGGMDAKKDPAQLEELRGVQA
jgi:hypothetical protein